jgi:hypothetical protein
VRRLVPILIAGALSVPVSARAASVIVFPLDARGVSYDTAGTATKWVLETIRSGGKVTVVEPAAVEQQLGVKLTEQARACDYDVFCLVEVGEIIQGDRVLIGHVRLVSEKSGEKFELKLIVLDVAKATIIEVLIWKVPATREGGLEFSVRAAAKRLFVPPDAKVAIELVPKEARLYFFGDPVKLPLDGSPLAYWSGTYFAVAEAEGYHKKELKVVIPPSSKEAIARIPIELEPDPLYVPQGKKQAQPFDRTSRREGSGVTSEVAGAVEQGGGGTPIALTPWPWIGVAAGIGLGIGGGILMGNAQGDYNELSMQARYKPGITVTAPVAMERRDDARSRFTLGSGLMIGGVAVLAGTAIWMIVDWILTE